jgi:hypothetical protein
VPDIPEGDQWLFNRGWQPYADVDEIRYAIWNKYASSAGHLNERRIISSEAMTNTSGVFKASLKYIKQATDLNIATGINHLVLHGFNYSPPEAPFPGWVQYGTWYNERNPWWPYFKLWADYKSRLSWLFQQCDMQSNVAILQPLTDLWLIHGPQRDPFPAHNYPDYQHNLWEAVHKNGDGCDYISEKILHEASYRSGKLVFGPRSYEFLLIPETETMDMKTIQSLDAFTTAGGKVVFIGKKPFKSASYLDPETSDGEIAGAIQKLFDNHMDNIIFYPSPGDDLIQWYGALQEFIGHAPMVSIANPDRYLCQVAYRAGEADIFFFANLSLTENISTTAKFKVPKERHPWIWDTESGKKYRYPVAKGKKDIQLTLAPSSSLLIVFDTAEEGEIYPLISPGTEGKTIEGRWRLKLLHVNGSSRETSLQNLVDFQRYTRLKIFAGEAIYEKEIRVEDSSGFTYLDLGNVQGVSELTLNGKQIGVRWYGHHIYDISGSLVNGNNSLSIKVTTISGNYLKSLKNNATAQRWTKGQPYYPVGMMGPVKLL